MKKKEVEGWKELIHEQYLHLNIEEEQLNPQTWSLKGRDQFCHKKKNLMLTTETWCQMWQPAKAPEELSTYLVVPDLHQPVICPRNEVWLVPTTVIVNAVYSFLVAFQGEVGRWWSELPHLARKDPTKHNRVYSVTFCVQVTLGKHGRHPEVLYKSREK